jgi:D-serine deaminase-like pyridoxal phosphate-dependent protein
VCQAEQWLPAPTVACNATGTVNSARTARAEVRAGVDGAPDSEQDMSGAPPDCPVAHMSEAPTVES